MRVKTRVAAKDYPAQGIKKGDTYYSWSHYRGPKIRSLTPPKRSQLTQDDGKAQVYDAFDSLPAEPTADDVRDVASACEEASGTFSEKLENLPENFQQSETGERLQNNTDSCESAADDLKDLAGEIEDPDSDYWVEETDVQDGHSTVKRLDHAAIYEAVQALEPDLE